MKTEKYDVPSGCEVRFYYLRSNNQPYGCVCLIRKEDNTYYRGVALCSEQDVFKKTIARKLSFAYAKKAIDANDPNFAVISKVCKAYHNTVYSVKCANVDYGLNLIERESLSEITYAKSKANVKLSDYEFSIWKDLCLSKANKDKEQNNG